MSDNNEVPWLISIVPPPDIVKRIDDLRKEFSENFNCFKALKPPVHLTLYAPVKLADADMEAQIIKLRRWVSAQEAFRMELKNFAFFENAKSPVIYIDVVPDSALKALNTGITREVKKLFGLEDLSRQTFRPHFTIGYRDISPEIFPQVKQAYSKRTFNAVFKADAVTIFRHNSKKWISQYQLPLSDEEKTQGSLW